MTTNNQLEYNIPRKHRRFFANFIDLFCIGFVTFLLLALSNTIVNNTQFYKDTLSKRNEIQLKSGLYHDSGEDIITYIDTGKSSLVTTEEKKDYVATKIDEFYKNSYFFNLEDTKHIDEYNNRKLNAKVDNNPLFIKSEDKIIENNVLPQLLYDFYAQEINDYCFGYLLFNDAYLNTTQVIAVTMFVQILIDLTISISIFYLIFPLTFFRRGRLTFGRWVFRIGLVSKNAINVTWGKFTLRFLFVYGVYFIVSFFSFLIPVFVSFAMQMFSKRGQNLVDYVFNQYMVDISKDEIYFNAGDYILRKDLKKESKIDNKNLKLR